MIIIGITGTLGAGKGTIVEYLVSEKGFAHYSVRSFLLEKIREQGLPENRDSMFNLANELRAIHGPSYVTDQLYNQALVAGENCVIESIRTPGEADSLRRNGNFFLLAVDAEQELRYQRKATDKKLHDALERGVVPVSREVSILASLAAILIVMVFVLPPRTEQFVGTLVHFLDDPAGWRLERASDVIALGEVMTIAAAQFLAPTVILLMVFGVVASVAQNPPRIVPDRIIPDLSRISLHAGLSRVFGPKGWTEFLKSVVKIVIVVVVVAIVLEGNNSF